MLSWLQTHGLAWAALYALGAVCVAVVFFVLEKRLLSARPSR